MAIKLGVVQQSDFQVIHITLDGGVCAPDDLCHLAVPADLDYRKGVILSGRAPVWVFCHLAHLCHPTPWVATMDPRLDGGVVIQRHANGAPEIGSIVKAG